MKRLLPSSRKLSVLLAGLLAAVHLTALTPTEWEHRQDVKVAAPGLIKLPVPAATFDASQPGLSDVRLLDPTGHELGYLLDRDLTEIVFVPPAKIHPLSFKSTQTDGVTQLLIETGTTSELDGIYLESSAPFFLKAAHGEISRDGIKWESIGPAVPIFRQFGAEHFRLALGGNRPAFIRVSLDDSHSRPVVFSGATLEAAPTLAKPPLPVFGAKITRREEFAGETVLTVSLDASHAPLDSLSLEIQETLFMRHVTVTVREAQGAIASERLISSGTLYRVSVDGAPARELVHVPLGFSPTTRELLVHIHNADSPPLVVTGVAAWQYPVNLFFMAPSAGTYTLLTGNAQATAPRYDLAAFAGDLRTANTTLSEAGALEPMPNYHPRESLGSTASDLPLTGSPLDAKEWKSRRSVQLAHAGVQELELDPAVLAKAQSDLGDLRLLRAGNQIPYLLEQSTLARALKLNPVAAPDQKRPSTSVWQVHLPHAGLPLRRLVFASTTPLFQRQFRIFEKLNDQNGGAYELVLASGDWSRTPEPGVPETRSFEIGNRTHTDTLWIETNNGDNPAITLDSVQAIYPVSRMIFKTGETDGITLAYGNALASAPRYDLSLVAVKLLTAPRNPAALDASESNSRSAKDLFAGLNGGPIFWAALGFVVVVLLVVVAKLLPKSTT